ncbi:hypothetical protein G6F64_015322 [Rhizopus arrhizus]|uniref:Uncharacterized protein n=1 Tax=Rhizopus oryzae TaxID=64495 RepID=A0A9P6WRR9_RHIOR|nr:hypothetical protein G6F64_015322 [Rhizopus arrhizus]
MLGRSRPSRPEGRTHAYLMLLRVEVAAFPPAMPPFVAESRDTEMAVPVRASTPAAQSRLCGPIPQPRPKTQPDGR